MPESLLEDILQLGGHRRIGQRSLADRRHDGDHVDLFRADAQAVRARRAQPQVGVGQQLSSGLDLAVDLARSIVAHDVDGAYRHALATAVTPFQRLATGQSRNRLETVRADVGKNAWLEHPVPSSRQFHLAP